MVRQATVALALSATLLLGASPAHAMCCICQGATSNGCIFSGAITCADCSSLCALEGGSVRGAEGEPPAVTTALVVCQRFPAAQGGDALATEEVVWCLGGARTSGRRPGDNHFAVKEGKAGDAALAGWTGAVAGGIQLAAAWRGAAGIWQQKKRHEDQCA